MRYQELITDAKKPVGQLSHAAKSLIEGIKTNCKPFLQAAEYEIKPQILYRGMLDVSSTGAQMGVKNARLEKRSPLTTTDSAHNDLNDYFNKVYGHPYRNGVFCTGHIHNAADYGPPYAIFPVGNFDFIYHDTIIDLYISVIDDQAYSNWVKMAKEIGVVDLIRDELLAGGAAAEDVKNDWSDEMEFAIHDWQTTQEPIDLLKWMAPYKSDNIQNAITSTNEIMIWCKQYYYMPPDMVDKVDWKN